MHILVLHVLLLHMLVMDVLCPNPCTMMQVLKINPAVSDIDGFKFEDFELIDYAPHKAIPMKMAV